MLLECGNASARKPYRQQVLVLRDQLEELNALIHPTTEDWRIAWDGYRAGLAAQAGIVDQVSFAVLRRLGLRQVFTNDRHFRSAGFETLF